METQNFQGTSQAGDFQSALQEAINEALTAFSFIDGAAISDQRIAWKLIEISGSKGGFLGEKTITVTIEARAD